MELLNNNREGNYHKKDDGDHLRSKQRRHSSRRVSGGRKSKVYPAAMINNDGNSTSNQQRKGLKKKPNLTVDTSAANSGDQNGHCSPATPNGVRGSRDLRSPGMPKSPTVSTAIPDFITQTDANGNATTPRSAKAIEGAARAATKVYPSSSSPKSGRRQQNADGNDSDSSSDTSKDMIQDSFVDSFRMMCCCLSAPSDVVHSGSTTKKKLSSKETQDSDENLDNTKDIVEEEVPCPKLLGAIHPNDTGKKCLVLDLDETLVHSSFRAVEGADFVIPVKIEETVHFVYVMKRPGVDEFLLEMAKHYEIVIYTASLNKYADPLLDLLDPHRVIRYRLFRESCVFFEGNYVKDLNVLDRDLSKTIIIDNSPNSYLFHPQNAIDCSSFIDDPRDRELDQIGAFLKGIRSARDVRGLAPKWKDWPVIDPIEEE